MSDGIKVWYDKKLDCYTSNVAIVLGKRWGIEPVLAGALITELCKDELKKAGATGVFFTLAGSREPVWSMDF